MKRYVLIGGNRTETFTSLAVVGHADSKDEAAKLISDKYEECGGLLIWIDTQTGEAGEPV